MSATLAPPPAPLAPPDEPLWPITVAMFTDMVYAGIIPDDVRVYLHQGRLAPRMTIGRPHTNSTSNTYDCLFLLRVPGIFPEHEQAMALRTEPTVRYPDVKLVRGRRADYPRGFPTTADVPLVVEVADTSLPKDRALALTYAREGIPVYWLVNIEARTVEVYDGPGAAGYARLTTYAEDEVVPVVVDGREVGRIAARDLLP
jgi:Uma2 family endonuclease